MNESETTAHAGATLEGGLVDFWSTPSLSQLAEEQQVQPITCPAALAATFWEEDDVEEFLIALRVWRDQS